VRSIGSPLASLTPKPYPEPGASQKCRWNGHIFDREQCSTTTAPCAFLAKIESSS
jgi:hypothetical protein